MRPPEAREDEAWQLALGQRGRFAVRFMGSQQTLRLQNAPRAGALRR